MTDRYQPLRDAIAARSWPVGDSFQRNMRLIADLLEERDHLHEECHEQARLLGMSGSREAKLLAERDALREALSEIAQAPCHRGMVMLDVESVTAIERALGVGDDA